MYCKSSSSQYASVLYLPIRKNGYSSQSSNCIAVTFPSDRIHVIIGRGLFICTGTIINDTRINAMGRVERRRIEADPAALDNASVNRLPVAYWRTDAGLYWHRRSMTDEEVTSNCLPEDNKDQDRRLPGRSGEAWGSPQDSRRNPTTTQMDGYRIHFTRQ